MATLFENGRKLAATSKRFELSREQRSSLHEAARRINAKWRRKEREAWQQARQIILTD